MSGCHEQFKFHFTSEPCSVERTNIEEFDVVCRGGGVTYIVSLYRESPDLLTLSLNLNSSEFSTALRA